MKKNLFKSKKIQYLILKTLPISIRNTIHISRNHPHSYLKCLIGLVFNTEFINFTNVNTVITEITISVKKKVDRSNDHSTL
jgi:hypothetical protein